MFSHNFITLSTRGSIHLNTEHPEEIDAKENNKQYDQTLVMPWTKPYLPKWFKGKVIAIVNDPASMNFLKKRRDAIFYKWEGNTVFQKRFICWGH